MISTRKPGLIKIFLHIGRETLELMVRGPSCIRGLIVYYRAGLTQGVEGPTSSSFSVESNIPTSLGPIGVSLRFLLNISSPHRNHHNFLMRRPAGLYDHSLERWMSSFPGQEMLEPMVRGRACIQKCIIEMDRRQDSKGNPPTSSLVSVQKTN